MSLPWEPHEIEEIEGWLKSPTLGYVFEEIEMRFTTAWKHASTPEDREQCWQMLHCARQVLSEIRGICDDQKVEQHNARRAQFNDWAMPRASTEDL